jgi:DNA-binding MarR family transcriptional regulator
MLTTNEPAVKEREMDVDQANVLIPPAHVAQSRRDFPDAYDAERIQVFHAVRALAQRMNDATTGWLAPFGLSASKFNYLVILYARREAGLTANELGALVHTVSGTVTSMIDSLVREGLVSRSQNPRDGRSSLLRLTPKGARVVRNAATAHHEQVEHVLASFSGTDCATLLGLIVRAGNALHAANA